MRGTCGSAQLKQQCAWQIAEDKECPAGAQHCPELRLVPVTLRGGGERLLLRAALRSDADLGAAGDCSTVIQGAGAMAGLPQRQLALSVVGKGKRDIRASGLAVRALAEKRRG